MSHILFIDESGHDLKNSPYEVIAGISIQSNQLWALICKIHELEKKHFGRRYSRDDRELKAKKILKAKTFRLASQMPLINMRERVKLAKKCLENGQEVTREELTALAQAKLAFVKDVLEYCLKTNCKIFASISNGDSQLIDDSLLRKDYVYLFERYYYFLKDQGEHTTGLVVFDELEKSKSHILISQIEDYFKKTFKGRKRSSFLIPEPFFVHSDLTTGVQLADIVAYLISWGLRLNGMNKPVRKELQSFVEQILRLRHKTTQIVKEEKEMEVWSITYIN